MNWEDVTPNLYKNIKPTKGFLGCIVDKYAVQQNKFLSLWIEFEMNTFTYNDPFYGEQESTSQFNMEVNLNDIPQMHALNYVYELENMEVNDDSNNCVGAFSNSLHFTVPFLRFGKIIKRSIEFEMEYCLTNSDSYGMMTGTIDDHLKATGKIEQLLEIKDLILIKNNSENLNKLLSKLNSEIYNINKVTRVTDNGIEYQDRTQFYVEYNSILPSKILKNEELLTNVEKRKWWKF